MSYTDKKHGNRVNVSSIFAREKRKNLIDHEQTYSSHFPFANT